MEQPLAGASEHHEHRPSPRLAPWVERATGYRIAGFPTGVHVGMPSGTVTLVVPLDAPLTLSTERDGPRRDFHSVLAGLSTGPEHIHHDGFQHGVQLALRPGAVYALFGVQAAEMAESSFELQDVMGPDAARLRERLHETDCWTERFELVEKTLLAREREVRQPPAEVTEAWRLITVSRGGAAIHDVARTVGWSMRRLQLQFRAEFGLSPKAVARVRRFERSVPLVSAGVLSLTDVAVRCGWADHAHMNRDWRDLAGLSPSRWRTDDALIGT